MKSTLHSPLFYRFLDINKNIFALLLFSSFLLTSNLVHAQLPQFEDFEGGFGTWNDGGSDAHWMSSTLLNGF